MKEILFTCLVGRNRSPTGARIFNENFEKEGLDYHASYAGVVLNRDNEAVQNAHRIVAVNNDVADILRKDFPDVSGKIREMAIPDCYHRDDEVLCLLFQAFYVSKKWE